MEEINSNSFCFGFFYGAFASGLIALFLNKIREARVKSGLRDRSLNNFPDAAQPNMTSAGVVKTSRQAIVSLFVWGFVLAFFVGTIVAGLYFILV
jgi:hypothetical protein